MSEGARPDWATLPNLVTVLRLVLLLPVCATLVQRGPSTLAVVLLLVWASTDWIDGALARATGSVSRTGELLDPVADRIGVVVIVLTLAIMDLLPWAALVVIVAVDVLVTALASRAALGGKLGVSTLGKVRTALLMTSVFLLAAAAAWAPGLVGGVRVLLWIGVGVHVASGADYVVRAVRGSRGDGAERG